jgi:hypothetical protein
METRLACAHSLIDIENNGEVGMVTGWPDGIMERVHLIISQFVELMSLIYIQDQPSYCVVEESKASGVLICLYL